MLSQSFLEEMKQVLLSKKQKLEEDLKGLSKHTELGSDIDSQVQEVEDDEVNQDLIVTIQSDLEKINKALNKIENRTYGIDDEGKEIPEERLRAIPWADKSI